jgi:phthiocerol/phenolphthiocerol synthesis type-I polyketide synthase D
MDIAVIGVSCQMPKAANTAQYWQNLIDGELCTCEVESSRWPFRIDPEISPLLQYGALLDRAFDFDNEFFNINTKEARQMDPQQRLLLKHTWLAFEDAGIKPSSLAGQDVGVYVGVMGNEWGSLLLPQLNALETYSVTGNGYCMIPNRVSYFFDFRGPSIALDTACSSSLVAIEQACRGLKDGRTKVAVAAGVNLILSPVNHVFYHRTSLAAKDGRCKPFSSDADGIVRGEGVGVVILKTLEQAKRDGDYIYAVIKGARVAHNGRSNGIVSPSRSAQYELLSKVYDESQVQAHALNYVECHGTGTLIGDPIELKALGEFLRHHHMQASLPIGSVKANIGHLEGAAGVASFIKACLMLSNQQVPPSINYSAPNPYIDFEGYKLQIVTKTQPLQKDPITGKSTIGISSFGLGGTICHAILQSAPH